MKRIFTILIAIFATASGFSQNCSNINPGSSIIKTGPINYKVIVNFTSNGQKHIDVKLFSGLPLIANLIGNTCIPTHGPGSTSIDFISLGNPTVTLMPGTGNCGGGNTCPADAVTLNYSAAAPLPIIMGSFYAKRDNNTVTLNWQTQNEINAKEFVIQANNGTGYTDIRTVPASNKTTGSTYTTTDNNSSKNNTLYRLKLVDMDGKFAYSEIRTVKGINTVSDFTIFPNPSQGNANVTISDISEPTDVQLIDNSGRLLKTVSMNNSNTAELNNLPGGMYLVRIVNKTTGASSNKKLVVIK
jgi:hypothetical protein